MIYDIEKSCQRTLSPCPQDIQSSTKYHGIFGVSKPNNIAQAINFGLIDPDTHEKFEDNLQ